MTITVEAGGRPSVCTCRCGCDYRLQSERSIAEAQCFSCRADLHAGRRKGWKPSDPPKDQGDAG